MVAINQVGDKSYTASLIAQLDVHDEILGHHQFAGDADGAALEEGAKGKVLKKL